MTTKATRTTEGEESPKSRCPSTPDAMAAMMETCGCGPMMAACAGAGRDADATSQEAGDAEGTEQGDGNG